MAEVIPNYLLDGCCCTMQRRYQTRGIDVYASVNGDDVDWSVSRSGLSEVTGKEVGTNDVASVCDAKLAAYPIDDAEWSGEIEAEFDYLIDWASYSSFGADSYAFKGQSQARYTFEGAAERALATYYEEDGEDDVFQSNSGIYPPETDLVLEVTTDAGLADRMVSQALYSDIPAFGDGTLNRRGGIVRMVAVLTP